MEHGVRWRRTAALGAMVAFAAILVMVPAPRLDAATAVDIVILGGESAVSASVETELGACATGSVSRIAGANRYETAAQISADTFTSAGMAYVATGGNFPDALAGGPPAALNGRPVLLVGDGVPTSTENELRRLGVSTVTVLGGPAVVSDGVVASLGAIAPTTRIAGSNRYATAAEIVQSEFLSAKTVYVATGLNFPDALAGVPAAAADAAPILLVQKDAIPAPTATQLSRLNPVRIKILGGEGVVSASVASALRDYAPFVIRLAGADRFSTAAAISSHAFPTGASKIYIATGLNYPDALAGGPAAGVAGAPILLVRPDSIPSATRAEIGRITGVHCGSVAPSLCSTQESVPAIECQALEAFYNATNGHTWYVNDGWTVDADPCTWHGVTCSGGAVTELRLPENSLSGSLPPELGDLESLTVLSLASHPLSPTRNYVTGPLPLEVGSLTGLTDLNLRNNGLQGAIPPQVGGMSSLVSLNLDANQISGSIPPELGSLAALEYLSLNANDVSGAIPASLGSLSSLNTLILSQNSLSGPIPPELGSLSNLRSLYAAANALEGTIPPQLGNLASLVSLSLIQNELEGAIPAQLGALTNLTNLYLGSNNLSGEVPTTLKNLPITPEYGNLQLAGQAGCLSTPDAAFAAWLTDLDPNWSDGC